MDIVVHETEEAALEGRWDMNIAEMEDAFMTRGIEDAGGGTNIVSPPTSYLVTPERTLPKGSSFKWSVWRRG